MKKLCTYVFLSALCLQKATAQNVFPSSGRTGIYTTSPATSFQVNGGARIGKGNNYVSIDSATGNLSFNGNAAYKVAGNKYAFQYAGNPNYGLFFNSSAVQYEFRNGSAAPVFYVGANTGNGIFTGSLKVGTYTLPATDGSNGQVLKTNGSGTLTWSNDANTTYVAGSGISISGSSISNTAPTQWGSAGTSVYYNGGNVGIGTSSPSAKLAVAGDALINGITVGRGSGSLLNNTAYGISSLYSNISGSGNTAIGNLTLYNNSNGAGNTASGSSALYSNTTGSLNTANGYYSLFSNTGGYANTASGMNSLYNNITGYYNTANGNYTLFSNTTGYGNTANGYDALSSNTTGFYNTASGFAALHNNTTGYGNVALGTYALASNKSGHNIVAVGDSSLFNVNLSFGAGTYSGLTAVGAKALFNNTTAYDNTGIGSFALYNTTSGDANTAIGSGAMQANTTGATNTSIGFLSLYRNTSGSSNAAYGVSALEYNTTGYSNVAIGTHALFNNTSAHNIVAVGDSALFNTNISLGAQSYTGLTAIGTKALYSNTNAFNNTGIGSYALYSATTGGSNTAVGSGAMQFNSTGSTNTAVGFKSLYTNQFGSDNVAFGYSALDGSNAYSNANSAFGTGALYGTLGSNNTGIGYFAGSYPFGTVSNSTAIGSGTTIPASNTVRVGNTAVTSIGGQVGWTTLSDGRFKENIKENVPGLSFINMLRPVTYKINRNKVDDFTGVTSRDKELAQKDPSYKPLAKDVYTQTTTGFIAQEVEQAAKKLDYDFSGVDAPKNTKDMYGLRYDEFVVPLVKAVQELSQKNDDLQKQVDELKKMITTNQPVTLNSQATTTNAELNAANNMAKLEQNIPNPFSNTTVINYYLPYNSTNAFINFYSSTGSILKTIKLEATGKGSINLKAAEMPSGIYRYALIINGSVVESKQMIISK